MRELIREFLVTFFTALSELWKAPADQALTYMAILGEQILYVVVVFLVVRWLWRKICKA